VDAFYQPIRLGMMQACRYMIIATVIRLGMMQACRYMIIATVIRLMVLIPMVGVWRIPSIVSIRQ
jgi:hypothetical protein